MPLPDVWGSFVLRLFSRQNKYCIKVGFFAGLIAEKLSALNVVSIQLSL